MHSSSTKENATKLRLLGKSYNEISNELKVSKSTLHSWLSSLQLSDKALERINNRVYEGSRKGLMKHNKMQTHKARQRAAKNRAYGRNKISSLSNQELLILGAALYWGEGYKKAKVRNGITLTHHPVSLSNSDPDIIKVFLKFLQECLAVEKADIRLELHMYDHMNEEELLRFWQNVTNLPRKNFTKTCYEVSISSQRKRGYNRLRYGTVQVRVNSTALYHQIMGLIDSLR